jgi:hypothetical protein
MGAVRRTEIAPLHRGLLYAALAAGTRRAPWSARITIAVVVILALLLL